MWDEGPAEECLQRAGRKKWVSEVNGHQTSRSRELYVRVQVHSATSTGTRDPVTVGHRTTLGLIS